MNRAVRILGLAASAAAAVAAMTGCASKGSNTGGGGGAGVPSFTATVPDEYRVLPAPGFHVPCPRGNCAVPDVPSLVVKDAKGAKVGLLIDPDRRQDNPRRMQIRICPFSAGSIPEPQMNKCLIHLVAAGDGFTDLGMKVTVRQLWWQSNDKDDALDAVITTA